MPMPCPPGGGAHWRRLAPLAAAATMVAAACAPAPSGPTGGASPAPGSAATPASAAAVPPAAATGASTAPALPLRGDPALMRPAPIVYAAGGGAGPAFADEELAKVVHAVSRDVLMVGDVRVDLARGVAEAPGTVTLHEGILEFLAVGKTGKRYESVLGLDVAPLHLHLALLLIGLRPASEPAPPPKGKPAPPPAGGDLVRVRVRFAGATAEVPAGALLVDRETGTALGDVPWRFSGSTLLEGRLMAESTGSLVAIWPDATALLNPTFERGNPYRGAKLGLEVSHAAVPAEGTAAVVVFSKAPVP